MQARSTFGRTSRAPASSIGLSHVLMIVAGLATFVLVTSVLRDRSATESVWMVRHDVAGGVTLSTTDLVAVEVAVDDALLPSLVLAADGVPDGLVRYGLTGGEPLLSSDLLAVDLGSVGRTFAIPIDSSVIDGLGLQPGDRVDVIGADGENSLGYVVADAEVVRLPSPAGGSAFAAAGSRSAWVTIGIDEREALLLSAALGRGPVELVRSTGSPAIEIATAQIELLPSAEDAPEEGS